MLDFGLQPSTLSTVGFFFVEFSGIVHMYLKNCMIYNSLITTAVLHFFVPFKIKCPFCAVHKCLVETLLWLVNPEHVLAI